MGTNGYSGQIRGPFIANQELFEKIKEDCVNNVDYISHIGVQAYPGTIIIINDKEIEIGRMKIYEASSDETEITSIKFKNNTDEDTIIDYHIL